MIKDHLECLASLIVGIRARATGDEYDEIVAAETVIRNAIKKHYSLDLPKDYNVAEGLIDA